MNIMSGLSQLVRVCRWDCLSMSGAQTLNWEEVTTRGHDVAIRQILEAGATTLQHKMLKARKRKGARCRGRGKLTMRLCAG